MRVVHPVLRRGRQLLYVTIFVAFCANAMCLGKRLTKNLLGNKADDIANFRQQLKRLHDAFIDETLVDIDANVLHIIQQVEFISEHLEEHGM